MMKYDEIIKKIEELEEMDFNYRIDTLCYEKMYVTSLLRKALILNNEIYRLKDKKKEKELYDRLNHILYDKFKQLNPDFSDDVIMNMVKCCYRGPFQCPLDIFVIDDAVFTKEATYDDFGSLYKVSTFLFDTRGIYFSIYNWLAFCQGDIFNDFSEEKRFRLTKEEKMEFSKFISDNINQALYGEYHDNVTKPMYELNSDKMFGSCDGLVEGNVRNVNIYLNKNFIDIARGIKDKCECDIKMVVQKKDDISLYEFHQSFVDGKPVWNVQKLETSIWMLSKEALKAEKKLSGPQRKLKKEF